MSSLTRANVRSFLARPWDALEALERDHWRTELQRDPLATFAASAALWEHLRDLGHAPASEERQADLAAHTRLRRLLDRTADAFRTG